MKPIISEKELLKLLPHGSGINNTWDIIENENGSVTAKNNFHAMNQRGYYNEYMPFTVRIFRVKKTKLRKLKGPCKGQWQIISKKDNIDFDLTCNDNRLKSFVGLKDYLTELIIDQLDKILTPIEGAISDKEAQEFLIKGAINE